jgi:hypothetical protein
MFRNFILQTRQRVTTFVFQLKTRVMLSQHEFDVTATDGAEIINPLLAYINLPPAYIELTLVKACATIMDV